MQGAERDGPSHARLGAGVHVLVEEPPREDVVHSDSLFSLTLLHVPAHVPPPPSHVALSSERLSEQSAPRASTNVSTVPAVEANASLRVTLLPCTSVTTVPRAMPLPDTCCPMAISGIAFVSTAVL